MALIRRCNRKVGKGRFTPYGRGKYILQYADVETERLATSENAHLQNQSWVLVVGTLKPLVGGGCDTGPAHLREPLVDHLRSCLPSSLVAAFVHDVIVVQEDVLVTQARGLAAWN